MITASIQTNQQELVRLDSLHQQHVQTNLNAKKRLNMQKLTGELRSDVYNVSSSCSGGSNCGDYCYGFSHLLP